MDRDRAGEADQERDPAREEGRQRAVRLVEEDVVAPRTRHGGRQLGQSVRAPQTARTPPTTQRMSINWLLPTKKTVNPDVVRTPMPIMLETTTKVAVARPNGRASAACSPLQVRGRGRDRA